MLEVPASSTASKAHRRRSLPPLLDPLFGLSSSSKQRSLMKTAASSSSRASPPCSSSTPPPPPSTMPSSAVTGTSTVTSTRLTSPVTTTTSPARSGGSVDVVTSGAATVVAATLTTATTSGSDNSNNTRRTGSTPLQGKPSSSSSSSSFFSSSTGGDEPGTTPSPSFTVVRRPRRGTAGGGARTSSYYSVGSSSSRPSIVDETTSVTAGESLASFGHVSSSPHPSPITSHPSRVLHIHIPSNSAPPPSPDQLAPRSLPSSTATTTRRTADSGSTLACHHPPYAGAPPDMLELSLGAVPGPTTVAPAARPNLGMRGVTASLSPSSSSPTSSFSGSPIPATTEMTSLFFPPRAAGRPSSQAPASSLTSGPAEAGGVLSPVSTLRSSQCSSSTPTGGPFDHDGPRTASSDLLGNGLSLGRPPFAALADDIHHHHSLPLLLSDQQQQQSQPSSSSPSSPCPLGRANSAPPMIRRRRDAASPSPPASGNAFDSSTSSSSCSSTTTTSDEAAGVNGVRIGANGPLTPGPPLLLHSPSGNSSTDTSALLAAFASARHHEDAIPVQSSSSSAKTTRPRSKTDLSSYDFPSAAPHFHLPARAALRPWPSPTNMGAASSSAVDHRDQRGAIIPDTVPIRAGSVFDPSDDEDDAGTARGVLPPSLVAASNGSRRAHDGNEIRHSMPRRISSTRPTVISQRKSSLLLPKGKERVGEALPASSSTCGTLTAAASVALSQPDKRVFKLWELVEGEVQYTEDLVTLVHVYLHHLYLLPSFCPSRRAIIARNTLDLLMLHKRFSKALVDVLAEEGIRPVAPPTAPLEERSVVRASRRIAAVFVHEAPDFAAYQEYCSGHDEALAVIREVELTPEWLAFERRCSALAASRTRPDLQTLLDKAEEDTEIKLSSSSTSTTPFIFSKKAPYAAPVAPSTARTDGVSSSIDANQSGRRTSMPPSIMATPPTPTLASTPSPASRLMLRDLLIKPVQRICRYPLVLTSLLGSQKAIAAAASSSDHDGDESEDEGEDLENALGVMRAVAEGVDEATQSKANRARTNLIWERFEPHVSLTPAIIRALDECLLVGALDVIYQHATYAPLLPPIKVRYLAAFLFADYLVLAKVRKGRAYQALFYMSIHTMSIVDGASLGSETLLSDSVRLVGNGYSYELGTTCPREKQIWLSALRAAQSASSSSHKIPFPTSAPEIFPPRIISRRMSSYNAGEVKELSCTAAAAAAAGGAVAGGSAAIDNLNVIGGKRNSLPGLELSTSSFAEAASSDVSGFVSASSTPWTSRSPSSLNSPTLSTFPLAPGSSGSSSSSAYPTSFALPMLNSSFALPTVSGGGPASSAAPILFRKCSPPFREAVNRALTDVMSESIATARSLTQLDRGFALDSDGGHLSLSFATMTNSPSRGSIGSAVDTVKRKMTPREGSHLSRRKSLIDLRVWTEGGGQSQHAPGSSSATATKSMSVSPHHSHLTAMSPSSSTSYSSTATAGASAHPIPRTKSDLGLSRKDHFLRRASVVTLWPAGGDSSGNMQKSPIEMEESDVLRFSGPRGNAHAPIRAATVDMIGLTPLRDESSLSTSHSMEKSQGGRPPSSYQTMKASIKRRSSFVENWTSGGRSKSQPPSPAMSRRPLPLTELHSQPQQSPTLPPMPTAAPEELAASPIGGSSMASSTVSLAGIVVPPSSMTANEISLFPAGGRDNRGNCSSNSSNPSLPPAVPTSLSRDTSPSVSRSNSRVSLAAWPMSVRKKSSASTSTSNVSVVQHDGSSGPPSASASVTLSRPGLIQRSLSSISRRRTKSSPMGQPPPLTLDPELIARAKDASGVSLSSGPLGVRMSSRLAPPAEGGAEATELSAPVLSPLMPLSPFEVEGMTTTDEHGVQQMTTIAPIDQSLDTKDNTLADFFTSAAARPASSSLRGSGGEPVQQQPETSSSPSGSTSDDGGAASAPLKKRRSLRWGAGFARSMGFTPLPNPST